ncbi:hypothetical protein IscW_ISCW015126 [Ixodes scapularis]|uniref:Uncharacterized protein n=1 Tax=Ixodes scapularis TaxID=6945 RepID=B7QNC8_IXOSC|nr:hypothetical protein IscW_ISCW015126 [Ixodes scapularis]|eukprot:XP_002416433.1 hypothetical protein IscW_ISCW015126 [Ixodes scapularis]
MPAQDVFLGLTGHSKKSVWLVKNCNFFKLPSQCVMWVRCSARAVRIQDALLPALFKLYKAS